jgi:hypothetical protein
MFKQILDKLPLATILLSYFFVCGGLYLIGFWTTFNIDITNFVSITDIPKSFVLPFVLSQGVFLLQTLTNALSSSFHKDEEVSEISKAKKTKSKLQRILYAIFHWDTLFSLAVAFIIYFSYRYKTNPIYWSLSSLTVAFYLVYKFTSLKYVKTKIPYFALRLYVAYIICLLPIFCFSTGKILSVNIYNNKDIMYINTISDSSQSGNTSMNFSKRDSSSLKLLGFLGDKLIISSINNKKIIFVNQSSFKTVELTKE